MQHSHRSRNTPQPLPSETVSTPLVTQHPASSLSRRASVPCTDLGYMGSDSKLLAVGSDPHTCPIAAQRHSTRSRELVPRGKGRHASFDDMRGSQLRIGWQQASRRRLVGSDLIQQLVSIIYHGRSLRQSPRPLDRGLLRWTLRLIADPAVVGSLGLFYR